LRDDGIELAAGTVNFCREAVEAGVGVDAVEAATVI